MFKIIKRSIDLVSHPQASILSAATVIIIASFFSNVLGLLRERLMLMYFTTEQLGPYYAAFRIPDAIFQLLILGALSTAFIPVFTQTLVKDGKDRAFHLVSNVVNVCLAITALLIIPLFIFTPALSHVIVPGFAPHEREVFISLTRVLLVGQLLPLILGNFFVGILQSMQRFVVPAFAPVAYNVGIILGVWTLSPRLGLSGIVWGVVIGACLYFLIQIPLVFKLGFRYLPIFDLQSTDLRRIGKLMLPRTLGGALYQIGPTVELILLSLLGTVSVSIFHYASKLQQVPVGLFGATFAQAALPAFSAEAAKEDLSGFKKMLLTTMHQILFFVLPASVMLVVLRTPIVRLVYGAERFSWEDTVLTGQTLSLFAFSIFAQSLVQLFTRAFFALLDSKTPVIINIFSVFLYAVMSALFILFWHLPVWSLAVSASVSGTINVVLLFIFLYKKISGFDLKSLLVPPLKMITASLITGIFLYVPIKLLDQLVFDTTKVLDLMLLTGVASISGLSVYIFLAWFLNIEEVGAFFKLLQRVKQAPRMIFTETNPVTTDEGTPIPQ